MIVITTKQQNLVVMNGTILNQQMLTTNNSNHKYDILTITFYLDLDPRDNSSILP